MNLKKLLEKYEKDKQITELANILNNNNIKKIRLSGLVGSSKSLLAASIFNKNTKNCLFILPDKETAAYFANDLESVFNEKNEVNKHKKILFYPTSYKRPYEIEQIDNINLQLRTEVLSRIGSTNKKTAIISYPEALSEKVISRKNLIKNTLKINSDEKISVDFTIDIFNEYNFERCDFVIEPGQFAIRGGIIDVFSYSDEFPFRIEFFGDKVESIRSFDPITQLSVETLSRISIVPNIQDSNISEQRISIIDYLSKDTIIWMDDNQFISDRLKLEYSKATEAFQKLDGGIKHLNPDELFINHREFNSQIASHHCIEFSSGSTVENTINFSFNTSPQPSFNKNFELLLKQFKQNTSEDIFNYILSDSSKQTERLYTIFEDIQAEIPDDQKINFQMLPNSLHEGFIDRSLKIACFTDHQLFERYHRFQLKSAHKTKEAITLKEIYDLSPGDYVTHIDHGIGRFDGLEKIVNNGREQEAIRLIYKNNDLLYISIHSLHRIAKYVGKEGTAPSMNKLGSNAWSKLKTKTKQRVKDIAKDLIKLYAKRKSIEGFQFSPDTYLQHELEASFIYEDTPDQLKSTQDIKKDLEKSYPMDRLICGDVGFGKTEIAIRAAFKAVTDSKQVAVLVPTTILALQHYRTFSDRLKDFPCRVDYINRFKSSKQQKETLKDLKAGKIDILIGTHRLASKDVEFKDLGLLIIDEEQKFGVALKEKLRQIKVNVDTLTLTATPIPRTLQFSLMGARDLSIINTAPPNRYPVNTELRIFSEEIIREGILYEVSRGGQVFFVHNRVQNIQDVKLMIEKFCPDVKVEVAHGQMEGKQLEKIMMSFINEEFDVLLATTIIESGLDIPNANTIFINEAQNYGLSDLHQLRGRVGRTNKKAFCYLLAPPLSSLTDEARKRLRSIEEFAELGSGFNIAMRDLDIRGAGNILGGEQSGFISEIGFEMYNQILDEALHELKSTEFKSMFEEETLEYVKDCQIETDLEILFPDKYITHISERMSLYKELDSLKNEEELMGFHDKLIDRFGALPKSSRELLNTIRLRWMAKTIGFEKLILKNNRMTGYFASNPEASFYQSSQFGNILKYVQQNPSLCKMREKGDKLTLSFESIKQISDALHAVHPISEFIKIQ